MTTQKDIENALKEVMKEALNLGKEVHDVELRAHFMLESGVPYRAYVLTEEILQMGVQLDRAIVRLNTLIRIQGELQDRKGGN